MQDWLTQLSTCPGRAAACNAAALSRGTKASLAPRPLATS